MWEGPCLVDGRRSQVRAVLEVVGHSIIDSEKPKSVGSCIEEQTLAVWQLDHLPPASCTLI